MHIANCFPVLLLVAATAIAAEPPAFPGAKGDWHGFARYDFPIDGKDAVVVAPAEPARGRPWVWHGEFFGHKPEPDIALLKRGFHVVYLRVPDMLGAPAAVRHWEAFYRELTEKYGFARKSALVGLSRGGLYCYNWAAAHPDRVACLYGDAPVCDFKSWPGGKGKGKGSPRDWKLVLQQYGFADDAAALAYDKNPVDNLAPLAAAKVPLLHVYGDADDVVPWDENTGLIAERYRKLGGSITLIAKPGVGHHPHGLTDPAPIVEFISRHAAEPIRVGILGLDNYQAVAFTQHFHDPRAADELAGLRVVAAFPAGSPDIEESVRELPKWTEAIRKFDVAIVDSVDALLAACDAVLVMSVDGRAHREQVRPALQAKKPVYVGRPLAASLADAVAMFRLADEHKTPLFSCSQHRFSPGFIGMRNHPEVGDVLGCDVYGGCPREPHHPDLFWHGIHGVETLYTIMRPGCVSVTRASTDSAELITGVWKDGRVGTYRGLRQGALKYSAVVFGSKGVAPAGIYGYAAPVKGVVPPGRYMGYEATAVEIARFFKTKQPPVSADETIELFAFLEAAEESKRLGGVPVTLASVLERARK